MKVLEATLKLLDATEGPLIEDFSEEEPAYSGPETVLACPVGLPAVPQPENEAEAFCSALKQEIAQYAPWYEIALKNRGRTTVGVSGLAPEKLGEFFNSFIMGKTPENPKEDLGLAYVVNLAVDDLKAYYTESMTAQPGQSSVASRVLDDWFWNETTAARIIFKISEIASQSEDGLLKMIGKALLIPSSRMKKAVKT
jgi:hypothetical protein